MIFRGQKFKHNVEVDRKGRFVSGSCVIRPGFASSAFTS